MDDHSYGLCIHSGRKKFAGILPERANIVDSRTINTYLEKEKRYAALEKFLQAELDATVLMERKLQSGLYFSSQDKEAIHSVFTSQTTMDPLQAYLRMNQISPHGSGYDLEGGLFLHDDLANLYTYGLVDFKKAAIHQDQLSNLLNYLVTPKGRQEPISDYYNGNRFLYHTFSRIEGRPPKTWHSFFNRPDLYTPFSVEYLETARRQDIAAVHDRHIARRRFLNTILSGKIETVEKLTATSPVDARTSLQVLNLAADFLNKTSAYSEHERKYLLSSLAYKGYEQTSDKRYLEKLIVSYQADTGPKAPNTAFVQTRFNRARYLMGMSYLKLGHHKAGVRNIESFLQGIDRIEALDMALIMNRSDRVQALNQSRLADTKRKQASQDSLGTMFLFATINFAVPGTGQLLAERAAHKQIEYADQAEVLQARLEQIDTYLGRYSLKLSRYLDKYEILDFLLELGSAYEELGRKKKALKYYKEGIKIIERQRGTIQNEKQRITYFSAQQNLYTRAIHLLIALNRPDEAWEYLERSKSRAFLDILAGGKLKVRNEDLTRIYHQRVASNAAIDIMLSQTSISKAQLDKVHANSTRAIQMTSRAGADPEFLCLSEVRHLAAKDIKSKIGKSKAILQYYLSDRTAVLFLIHNHQIKIIDLEVEVEKLQTDAIAWLDGLKVGKHRKRTSQRLYRALVQPGVKAVAGKQLIIIPHGFLHYLPLHALHDGSKYLIENYAVSYAPSSTVLEIVANKSSRGDRSALIVGNPTGDLIYAEKEAKNIAVTLDRKKLFLRNQATETDVMAASKSYDLIHFATHGLFDAENPLASKILLYKDNQSDGHLTAGELFSQNWNATLVTLSACESGLFKYMGGDELVGIQRALFFAGSKAVLTSLWKVDDRATGMLMETFYKKIQHQPFNVALQQAQIATMRKYKSPYYWAAFRLIGDYRGEKRSF